MILSVELEDDVHVTLADALPVTTEETLCVEIFVTVEVWLWLELVVPEAVVLLDKVLDSDTVDEPETEGEREAEEDRVAGAVLEADAVSLRVVLQEADTVEVGVIGVVAPDDSVPEGDDVDVIV